MSLYYLVTPNATGRSDERKGRAQGFWFRERVWGWIPRLLDHGGRKVTQDQAEVTDMGSISRGSTTGPGYYSSCPTTWTIRSSRSKGAWMAVADGDAFYNPWQAPTGNQQWRPLGIWCKACHQLQTTPPLLRSSNILLLCFSGEACLIRVLCFPVT